MDSLSLNITYQLHVIHQIKKKLINCNISVEYIKYFDVVVITSWIYSCILIWKTMIQLPNWQLWVFFR